ncbi:hypothetical protein [Paenibacillus sp. RUD330]|uniref:hypothetical protein n=1 Tax=Paenibacillus sp. RUD330 TaxID=2023772 RepID=UPI000B92D2D3|nr:hypothetical protein [Paenibacillus sp. RUD330]ASS66236.1 hypothetical protein CIC07_08790 [Paenibacillus sp. RUD330]
MDVRTMTAGPELDAVLARALGYEWIPPDAQAPFVTLGHWWIHDEPVWHFTPSTTWDGAGQVIEEMRRLGWDYILQSLDSGGHGARFDKWDVGLNRYVASVAEESESAPHAITIAAILALRSEAEHA